MSNKPKELVVYADNVLLKEFLKNRPTSNSWGSYSEWIKHNKLSSGDESVIPENVYNLIQRLDDGVKKLQKVGAILPNESVIRGIDHLHDRILTSSKIKWSTGGGPAAYLNKLGYSIRNYANKLPRSEIHHRVLAPAFALIYLHISDMRQGGSYSSLRLVDYKEDRGLSTKRYSNYKSILMYINNSVEGSPLRKIAESKAFIETYDGLDNSLNGPAKKRTKTSSSSSTGLSSPRGVKSPSNIKGRKSGNTVYDLTDDNDDVVIETFTSVTPKVKVVKRSRRNKQDTINEFSNCLVGMNESNVIESMLSIQNIKQVIVNRSITDVIHKLKMEHIYRLLHDGATFLLSTSGDTLKKMNTRYKRLLKFVMDGLESYYTSTTPSKSRGNTRANALAYHRFLELVQYIFPYVKRKPKDYSLLDVCCYGPSEVVKDVSKHTSQTSLSDLLLLKACSYIIYCTNSNSKSVLSGYIKSSVSGLVQLTYKVYERVALDSQLDKNGSKHKFTPFSLYLTIEVFARIHTKLSAYVGPVEKSNLRRMFHFRFGIPMLVKEFGKLENLITYPAVYVRVLTFCNLYPQHVHASLEGYLAIAKGMMRLSDDRRNSPDIKSIEEAALSIPLAITNYKLTTDLKPENDVTTTDISIQGLKYIKRYNVYIEYCTMFVYCITRLIKTYRRRPSKYIDNMNATISVIVNAYNTIGSDPSRIYYEPVTTGETTLYKEHVSFKGARQQLEIIKQSLSELEDAGFKTYSKLTIDGNSVKFVVEGNDHSSPSVDILTSNTVISSSTSSSSSSSSTIHVTGKPTAVAVAPYARRRVTSSVAHSKDTSGCDIQNDFTLWFYRMKNSKTTMKRVEKAVDDITKSLKKDPFFMKELFFDPYPTHLLAYQILYSNSPTGNDGMRVFDDEFIKDSAKRLLMANFTLERLQSLRNKHLHMIFTSFYNRLQHSKETVSKTRRDQTPDIRYANADAVREKPLSIPISVVTGQTIRDYAQTHAESDGRKVATKSDREYAELFLLDSYTTLIYNALFLRGTEVNPRLVYDQKYTDSVVLKYTTQDYKYAITPKHNTIHDIETKDISEMPETVEVIVKRMLQDQIEDFVDHRTVLNNYYYMPGAKLDNIHLKIRNRLRKDNTDAVSLDLAEEMAYEIVDHITYNFEDLINPRNVRNVPKKAEEISLERSFQYSDSESDFDDEEEEHGDITEAKPEVIIICDTDTDTDEDPI